MKTHILHAKNINLNTQELSEQSRILGSITLGQKYTKEEAEEIKTILSETGCKLAWRWTAFDEGFMNNLEWSNFSSWWPSLLAEWIVDIYKVEKYVGKMPDYLLISTENKSIPNQGEENTKNKIIQMVSDVINLLKKYAPDSCPIVYGYKQPVYSIRDGWKVRNWPWPEECNWEVSSPQLYNVNCPVEFKTCVDQARKFDLPIVPWISIHFGMSQPNFKDNNPNAQIREYDIPLTESAAAWAGQCISQTDRGTWVGELESVVILSGEGMGKEYWEKQLNAYIQGLNRRMP